MMRGEKGNKHSIVSQAFTHALNAAATPALDELGGVQGSVNACASSRSFGRPDACLLRIKLSLSITCTVMPSITIATAWRWHSSKSTPGIVVIMSSRYGSIPMKRKYPGRVNFSIESPSEVPANPSPPRTPAWHLHDRLRPRCGCPMWSAHGHAGPPRNRRSAGNQLGVRVASRRSRGSRGSNSGSP